MLRAGVSKVNITPPVGIDLTGYLAREESSQGIHDDLYVRVTVLDDGKQRATVVTCDLLAIDRDSVEIVRRLIEERTGMSGENVMITTSHTHSGPTTVSSLGLGKIDRAWLNVLRKKIAGAVYIAVRNMQQAAIGAGKGMIKIGINRRGKTPNGSLNLRPNLSGPTDPETGVIRIDDRTGNMLALLMNFGCHAVVLGSDNLLISADFPGYATEMIENTKSNGMIALFTNGGAGNVNPVRRGSFEEVSRLGTILGSEVLKVAEQIKTYPQAELKVKGKKIRLSLKDVPTLESIEETIKGYKEKTKKLLKVKAPDLDIKIARTLLKWAKLIQKTIEDKKVKKEIEIEVQVFGINNIALVGIPGEPFAEVVLDIKKRSKFEYTFVTGYTNGYYGYIPTKEAYGEGGYEVMDAYKYFGFPAALAPDSGEKMRNTALELLQGDGVL